MGGCKSTRPQIWPSGGRLAKRHPVCHDVNLQPCQFATRKRYTERLGKSLKPNFNVMCVLFLLWPALVYYQGRPRANITPITLKLGFNHEFMGHGAWAMGRRSHGPMGPMRPPESRRASGAPIGPHGPNPKKQIRTIKLSNFQILKPSQH